MFHARAASRRSAALPRQVGATITTLEGDIVAVGCNEVPKSGGGSYWEGDAGDHRDFQMDQDIKDEIIEVLLRESVFKLEKRSSASNVKSRVSAVLEGYLKEGIDISPDSLNDLLIKAIFHELEQPQTNAFQGARINGLLEFGRTIHGEMAALTNAALRGISVRDGTMYVTTFPCHMCAPHIVAAGIKRVVYIEPYPKSLVRKLYPDSISVDDTHDHDRVKFEPFFGFAPKIYMKFFDIPNTPKREYQEGDQKGKVIPWNKETMQCRTRIYMSYYLFLEMRAVIYIMKKLHDNERNVDNKRNNNGWNKLHGEDAQYGDSLIEDWLKNRKEVIKNDLMNVPQWMKQAFFPQGYNEDALS